MTTGWSDPASYWLSDLADACERVRCLSSDRGPTLHRVAYALGGRLGWPGASYDEALHALTLAGVAAGLSRVESRSHASRGLRSGAQRPLPAPGGRGSMRLPPSPPRRETVTDPPPPADAGSRLPIDDVWALWDRLASVPYDAEAAAWARSRGLDAISIDDADLARVLPLDGLDLPSWATSWATSGHRLIVPVYDAGGVLAGVRARHIGTGSVDCKTLTPRGQSHNGLILADDAGRLMLAGKAPAVREVWIVEGEPDFLTLACADLDALKDGRRAPRRSSDGVAVLGVYAGAWKDDTIGAAIVGRVPRSAAVYLATDNDPAGKRYADHAADSLERQRFSLRRARPPGTGADGKRRDWNDWWKDGLIIEAGRLAHGGSHGV